MERSAFPVCVLVRGAAVVVAGFLGLFSVSFADEPSPSPLQVHLWIRQLSSDDWILQAEALHGLGNWKVEEAVPEIERLFRNGKSAWLRGRAMHALALARGEGVVAIARSASENEDPVLRRAALETLALLGVEVSAPVAEKLLADEELSVRSLAASLYASYFPEKAWPVVDSLTKLEDGPVSGDLLRALAHIGSEDALTRLEELFEGGEEGGRFRRSVVEALSAADDRAVPLLARLTVRHAPGEAAFRSGRELLGERDQAVLSEALLALLGVDASTHLGNLATLAAEVCPTPELGDALARTWSSRDDLSPGIVRSGMAALGKIDASRYDSFFTERLADEDDETRALAVRCRGLSSGKGLFALFREHVGDENPLIARAALESLRRADPNDNPTEGLLAFLAPSFLSDDLEVRLASFDLLADRGAPEDFSAALLALEDVLAADPPVTRNAAAKALFELGGWKRAPEVAAAQGYVGYWKIVGPFINDGKNAGFATVYPPETHEDNATYSADYRWEFGGGHGNRVLKLNWLDAATEGVAGAVHVAAHMPVPVKNAVAYAKVDLEAESEGRVRAAVEVGRRLFQSIRLNGEEVALLEETETDERVVKHVVLHLRAGKNRVLVKTSTSGGSWWLKMRLMDEKEDQRASGLTFPLPPKPEPELAPARP